VTDENGSPRRRSLLLAWSPYGYHLHELDGDPPEVGAEFDHEGQRLLVIKVAGSPLPGDHRRCAYTVGA
jgi:hypothetical protein